jgi:uncharacterized protein YraI
MRRQLQLKLAAGQAAATPRQGNNRGGYRALTIGAAMATLLAIPSIAEAAWGQATGSVNMRACASTSCARIGVVPAGAQVWVGGAQGGWYLVTFNGRQGFVSGRYIATVMADRSPRFFRRGPAPQFGYMQQPWWDNQHQAWYDGRRWYRNGIWYNRPGGITFGFSFGG